jgi:transposase-like protein
MTTTAADKLVAVAQLLRGGHTHTQVAEQLGLTEGQVAEFARDIPGLSPAPARPTAVPPAAVTNAIHAPGVTPPARLVQHQTARPMSPVEQGLKVPIGRLLEDASGHSVAKVRNLAAKIETQLDQLRALIREHQATEQARRAEREAKEKARAEIARLEEQLRQAKAKLRAGSATPNSSGRQPAGGNVTGDYPCRKGCGKVITTAAARGNHEKHCTGRTA